MVPCPSSHLAKHECTKTQGLQDHANFSVGMVRRAACLFWELMEPWKQAGGVWYFSKFARN